MQSAIPEIKPNQLQVAQIAHLGIQPLRVVIALSLQQMIANLAVLVIAHEAIHGITSTLLNRGRPDF